MLSRTLKGKELKGKALPKNENRVIAMLMKRVCVCVCVCVCWGVFRSSQNTSGASQRNGIAEIYKRNVEVKQNKLKLIKKTAYKNQTECLQTARLA